MDDKTTKKLFAYLEEEFGSLRAEMKTLGSNQNHLQKGVDAYAKQSETYMQEMLALAHKVDRLERWIMKIAQETGVKLVA